METKRCRIFLNSYLGKVVQHTLASNNYIFFIRGSLGIGFGQEKQESGWMGDACEMCARFVWFNVPEAYMNEPKGLCVCVCG